MEPSTVTKPDRVEWSAILLCVFLSYTGFSLPFAVLAPLFIETDSILVSASMSATERSTLFGVVISLYSLGQFLGSLILGPVSDRHGRRRSLLVTLFGASCGSALICVALLHASVSLFLFARFLTGFCEANTTIAQAIAADASHGSDRTKRFSQINTAASLGWVVGPFFGGLLSSVSLFGWPGTVTLFALASLISFGLFLLCFVVVHHRVVVGSSRSWNWTSIRQVKSILTKSFFLVMGFACFQQFFPLVLIENFAFEELQVGYMYSFLSVMWVVSQQGVVNPMAQRIEPRRACLLCCFFVIPCLLWLPITEQFSVLLMLTCLIALFISGALTNVVAWISSNTAQDAQGTVLGANRSVQSLGRAVPSILAGYLAGIDVLFPMALGALFFGLVLLTPENEKAPLRRYEVAS